MIDKRLVFCFFTLLLFSISCKKKQDATVFSVGDYTKLTPGNYWIYESYHVDSTGFGVPGSYLIGEVYYDSIYVEKDTMIGSYVYHKLMKPVDIGSSAYGGIYLRDSANVELSWDGKNQVILAPNDYSTIFQSITESGYITHDSVMIRELIMADRDLVVSTPAGSFSTVAMSRRWTFIPGLGYPYPSGTTRVRTQYTRYAAGIGMVIETGNIYLPDLPPFHVERRLVRYHVQ